MMPQTLLSIHYLPCIAWFRHLLHDEGVVLDQHEHYVKQTYRNRCMILSANGPLSLIVPVKKNGQKQPVYAVEIENDFNWQKQHWEAIRSAYNSSPFFEHYAHHFEPFYTQEQHVLQDFNLALIRVCLRIMKSEKELLLSDAYLDGEGLSDLRALIHPKKKNVEVDQPYLQVFAGKFAFVPGLSIIDLLFNQGPEAVEYI